MESIFLVKLFISFFIGASWATITTLVNDKYGTKIGGLLIGLPSTTLFALFFIAWTQSPKIASQSTTLIPIINGINVLFLISYSILVKKNFWFALPTSYLLWFTLAYGSLYLRSVNFFLLLIIYFIILSIGYFVFEKVLRFKSATGKKIKYTFPMIAVRAIIGGGIIGLATILAKFGGPLIGGVFGTFPAMFSATLIITYFTHGASFSTSTMKSSMIAASSVPLHAAISRFTYANFDIVTATLIPLVISYIYGYLLYKIIYNKIS